MAGEASPPAPPEIPTRCHHCAGPLSKDMETSSWTVPPLVRDSFSMIGSAIGATAGAFYGFNHTMPVVRQYIKGPMWMHFLVGCTDTVAFKGQSQANVVQYCSSFWFNKCCAVPDFSVTNGASSYCLLFCMCWVSGWDNTSFCTAGFIILSLSHSVILLYPLNFS